jgi:hybrid polyketide synthase/nonribosomal peptide synthetase ACE1
MALIRIPNNIELRLVRAVGENLADAIRGNTNILEHMMRDNLLNNFYSEANAIKPSNIFLARMVEQLVHRHPEMKMLELGKILVHLVL